MLNNLDVEARCAEYNMSRCTSKLRKKGCLYEDHYAKDPLFGIRLCMTMMYYLTYQTQLRRFWASMDAKGTRGQGCIRCNIKNANLIRDLSIIYPSQRQ